MTSPLPKRLAPTARCLFTELGDGTGVVLHLDTKLYFTLNATGVVVWKRLSESSPSEDAIVEQIVSEFEVEEETARVDVRTVLSELLEQGLVTELSA